MAEVRKLPMVGKTVDSGRLSQEIDGRESCNREKDMAPE